MVERKEYLDKLISWKDEKMIKVITGMRRCGKSTLLNMYQDKLKKLGIKEKQIISINFEKLEYEELLDYSKLYNYITERLCVNEMTYVFLDEIQKVDGFEKVVDSLYVRDNVNIYITGSNAYLLSSDLATLLSGRYIEISMLPLSFDEFMSLQTTSDKEEVFEKYLRYGSLPYIATLKDVQTKADEYLESIYDTIVVKDIEERQNRRLINSNSRKVTDIALLKNISKFLASSIGNPISIKSIADYITSNNRKVSQNTISDYVTALVEPFIFYPVERFDVQGKQLLKTNRKLYIVDLGLRRHLGPKTNYDLGFSIENIVYLELLRRNYRVYVGKVGNTEVDFVCEKNGRFEYFQVSASIMEQNTFNREITPLKNIHDNHSKTILTLDKLGLGNYDGINIVNLLDWLLNK